MLYQSAADESGCVVQDAAARFVAEQRSRWNLLTALINGLNYFEIAQTVSGLIQRG